MDKCNSRRALSCVHTFEFPLL